jgi:2-polyprenyl-3-methyl-5-hydroxy-6-metoxy-1,4-benzoquinol methylase
MMAFFPPAVERVIDLGCGEGHFGQTVKSRFPSCETWGVEALASAAIQAVRHNDHVVLGSLEQLGHLPAHQFDVVTMNDVLEHLAYPEPALHAAKRLLRPQGLLILSIPNVRYYLNVRDLVFRNNWRYADSGVLDRTHMRFFTTRSASELLSENGFTVLKMQGLNEPKLKLHYRLLFAAAPRFFQWMRYPQFAVVAAHSDGLS